MQILPIPENVANLIFSLDLLGTVAFAVSGLLRGWQKRFNIVGVCFLAAATACGGGTVRDILRGRSVPFVLQEGAYLLVILITVFMMYLLRHVARYQKRSWDQAWESTVLEFTDALGLGVFAIIGASKALGWQADSMIAPMYLSNPEQLKPLFAFHPWWMAPILFAILTGAGGGIIRDVVANQVPYAFKSSLYALFPAIGGALFTAMVALDGGSVTLVNVLVPTIVVLVLRFGWWLAYEFEREQYSALILLRDPDGKYLMEEGRSGSMSLIGGKWQPDDGMVRGEPDLQRTILREIREELGLKILPEQLKKLQMETHHDRLGRLTFRERSLRTGEKVKYHFVIFDCISRLKKEEMDQIQEYRDRPILPRDRAFHQLDPMEISPDHELTRDNKTVMGRLIGKKNHPVGLGLLHRVRKNLEERKHVDGQEILSGLPNVKL